MLLYLRDVLLLVQFVNRRELHRRLRDHQTGTYIFRTCVFRRCGLVLVFSTRTFSTLANSYLRLQYLHFPSSGIAQFHTFHFHTCVFQYLHFPRPRLLLIVSILLMSVVETKILVMNQ